MELIGYHCSESEDLNEDVFDGRIDLPRYSDWVSSAMESLSEEQREKLDQLVKEYNEFAKDEEYHAVMDLNSLPSIHDEEHDQVMGELDVYLNEVGLRFIFVNSYPLKDYGENCYKVFMNTEDVQGQYYDANERDAYVYFYDISRPPKLKNYSDINESFLRTIIAKEINYLPSGLSSS